MSESRIRIGVGVGLWMLGVLWLSWPGSTAPTAPAPTGASGKAEGVEPVPIALDQRDESPEEIARKPVPARAPRQIQVLDAQTLEPVAGASVRYTSGKSPPTREGVLLARWRALDRHGKLDLSTRLDPRILERINRIEMNEVAGGTSDAEGMVSMAPSGNATYVWAGLLDDDGAAKITDETSILRVLIEPPISVMSVDAAGKTTRTNGVEAFLYADGKKKGPYRFKKAVGNTFFLLSLWKELRTWLDGRPYREAGILLGNVTVPRQLDVWLPIQSPVPSPVILHSPPSAAVEVKGRR